MNQYDIAEYSYKNGYDRGYKDALKDVLEQLNDSNMTVEEIIDHLLETKDFTWKDNK